MSLDHEREVQLVELSRAQREAIALTHAKLAQGQQGEAFTDYNRDLALRVRAGQVGSGMTLR